MKTVTTKKQTGCSRTPQVFSLEFIKLRMLDLAEAKTPHQDEIVETRRECDISTIQYEQIFINDTETQDKTNNLRSCLFEKDRGISLSFPK